MNKLIEKRILVNFSGNTLHKFIFHQLCKFGKFDAGNVIYFKLKFSVDILKRQR